jgi:hypothetical protein
MNQIQSHKKAGIGSVHDRHRYSGENHHEGSSSDITALAEAEPTTAD